MADFATVRGQLKQTRIQREASSRQLTVLRERLKSVERALGELGRVKTANDPAYDQRYNDLKVEADGLRGMLAVEGQTLETLDDVSRDLLGNLAALANPATQIEELSDETPILLLPVRLETRFKTVSVNGVDTPQLWLRVYPDDCHIDTFEELLSEAEVKSAQAFWVEMWKAGGIEADERGAWRMLVGSSGSGRAAWIVQSYTPLNASDKPVKADARDVVLVIVPGIAVTPAEEAAAFAYWIDVWKADGALAAEAVALAALRVAVGPARADEIIEGFAPKNLGQDPPKPYTRADVAVTCAKLLFDPNSSAVTKNTSWTQAPKVRLLPDRFVVMAYRGGIEVKRVIGSPIPDGLAAGPDPSLPDAEQVRLEDGELIVNEDLRWMVDFDHAVEVGMGFRIDLTADEAISGFDRLIVLGVRLSADKAEGSALLEGLLANHHRSKHGLGLIPQGSPTNNTEGEGAAYTWIDDPDASFDVVFEGKEAFVEIDDPYERRDGAWLAEHLGIDAQLLQRVAHASGRDQAEAKAMNTALWSATFGYFMEEMMRPTFSATDIRSTRRFFTRYVSGRGPVPALRIGRQPYGILPVTAFSRFGAGVASEFPGELAPMSPAFLMQLHGVLTNMDAAWTTMANSVKHVGSSGDPHQILLDIVGLHAGSVEYHQRYAESFHQIYNKLAIQLGSFAATFIANALAARRVQILTQIGHNNPNAELPILEKFFFGKGTLLTGPVIDDVPLSEITRVRAYSADDKNYLEWLSTAPFDKIRLQDFGGSPPPTALLYLLLRHSLMLSHWDAGVRILETYNMVGPAVRHEPAFIHVQQAAQTGSKFQHLYGLYPQITGDPDTTLVEYIGQPGVLNRAPEAEELRQSLRAIASLANTPTARLERVFAEHMDCASYRLDAWKTGLATFRLEELRRRTPGAGGGVAKGIYLGAYAWLEDLRPKNQNLTPAQLSPELATIFQKQGQAPLQIDPTNAGYIHAPSVNHAATAAILKNAYQVNASPANKSVMAVNLSSERVRKALSILEGIRNGQTLSALLGYRFERGLHDRHGLVEVDKFIYPLRQAFPLVADKIAPTKSDGTIDIGLLEARNVIDGARLITHIRENNAQSYPFGLPVGAAPGALPNATIKEREAIDAEIDALLDLHDAVSDLMLAEGVYQTVAGNFERAAASAEALGKGKHPPEPEVVMTPRSGRALTHRVALHLDAATDAMISPSAVAMTPRATAEAPLNSWLSARLPMPADVACHVTYTTPAISQEKSVVITQADLGLQPIDLLYFAGLTTEQAMTELDGRIMRFVRHREVFDPHPALDARIHYTQPIPGKVTFFELTPLLASLRALVLKSRYLTPGDMALSLEAESSSYTYDFNELGGRITAAAGALGALQGELVTLEADAAALDDYAGMVSDAFLRVALHGVPQTGIAEILTTIRDIYEAIRAKVEVVTTRWQGKHAEYLVLMATWPDLVTDEERFAMLLKAEAQIAASTTAVLPADPNDFKSIVEAKKVTFDARLAALEGLLVLNTNKLVDFLAAVDTAALSMPEHDVVPFDVEDQRQAMATLRTDLVTRVSRLKDDLAARVSSAGATLGEAAAINDPEGRLRRMLEAARLVLGDEIKLLPRFQLATAQGVELLNCWGDRSALVGNFVNGQMVRFPIDDWMYGLARVREKLAHWENAAVLTEAFGGSTLELTALQLPYRAADRWLGLEIPDGYVLDGDRLLYTAHFAKPFDPSASQCGLFLDEWTEIIPAKEEVTGVAFHFDQPNTEPPQVMLLVVPPARTGQWKWDDVTTTLHETLDAAKKRAVEPAQIDASGYAQILPATLMAVTLYQITIATNLAFNNDIYDVIGS